MGLFFVCTIMPGGKKKPQKMGLVEFLDGDDGDWAAQPIDDDEEPLPLHPEDDQYRGSGSNYERPGRGGYERKGGYERNQEYSSRPRRNYEQELAEVEIPNEPPFIAHVGNLSFQATDDDVGSTFAERCDVEDVDIPKDRVTGKSRGFCFVTFCNQESLRTALEANNIVEICGRVITVKVAQPRDNPSGQRGDRTRAPREPSRADQVDKWERGKTVNPPPRREREPREQRGGFERSERPRRNYDQPQRKPISLQPRTSDEPIGAPAKTSKVNPFGEAKPRDELAFQKKKEEERLSRIKREEEERAAKEKERASRAERNERPAGRKTGGFKGKSSGGSRDFAAARDNMGKNTPKPKAKQQDKSPQVKKFKPQSVQKESSSIPVSNIYSALKQDE